MDSFLKDKAVKYIENVKYCAIGDWQCTLNSACTDLLVVLELNIYY